MMKRRMTEHWMLCNVEWHDVAHYPMQNTKVEMTQHRILPNIRRMIQGRKCKMNVIIMNSWANLSNIEYLFSCTFIYNWRKNSEELKMTKLPKKDNGTPCWKSAVNWIIADFLLYPFSLPDLCQHYHVQRYSTVQCSGVFFDSFFKRKLIKYI
jgi:hypothetical protein